MFYKISLFISLVLNIYFFFNLKKISKFINLYDKPDHNRKIHKISVPTIGGLIFISSIFIFFINFFESDLVFFQLFNFTKTEFIYLFLFTFLFFLLGFFDDKITLDANKKLFITFFFIAIYLYLDDGSVINTIKFSFYKKLINLDIFAIPFTILSILLFVNAFNMFDGINLQSGFYLLFIFLILIIFSNFAYISFYFLICLLTFLILNYQSKIFLGDSGTLSISFLVSVLFIKSSNLNFFSADKIFLIMWLPGLDLLRVAIVRSINKKHPFKADRSHLHHLLLEKYGFWKCTFIMQFLLITPFLMTFLYEKIYLIILLYLLIYLFLIYKLLGLSAK